MISLPQHLLFNGFALFLKGTFMSSSETVERLLTLVRGFLRTSKTSGALENCVPKEKETLVMLRTVEERTYRNLVAFNCTEKSTLPRARGTLILVLRTRPHFKWFWRLKVARHFCAF